MDDKAKLIDYYQEQFYEAIELIEWLLMQIDPTELLDPSPEMERIETFRLLNNLYRGQGHG